MTALDNPYSRMSYPELCGHRKDYARLLHAATAARKAAGRHLTMIREAIDAIEHGARPYEASDHAVVRYLERVVGMDVGAIRDTIAVNCAGAVPTFGDNLRSADGHIYCINNEGMVTTILPLGAVADELRADVTAPRRNVNGDRRRARRTKRDVLAEIE